jgi:hypothetical protein
VQLLSKEYIWMIHGDCEKLFFRLHFAVTNKSPGLDNENRYIDHKHNTYFVIITVSKPAVTNVTTYFG